MGDSSSPPSPDNAGLRRINLPITHTGLLFQGPLVSVYYHRQPPFVSRNQSHIQTKVVVTFDLAAGAIRRLIGNTWQSERISGRGIYLFPPNLVHELQWECEGDLVEIYYEEKFFFELPSDNVAGVFSREKLSEAANDPVVWDFALAICLWCADQAPPGSVVTDIGALIGKRLVLHHNEPRTTKRGPRLTADQRRRLDEFIQANVGKKISVPQMARTVAMSISHFVVLCRNTTGRTPKDYLRECRLWKAHAMVRSGNYRRHEVAHACGFYDASHLNREFKKFFKHPPAPLAN